jgi:2-haloacid dehalogenase
LFCCEENSPVLCCEEVVVSVSHRWVSFDCFGTLVDWQRWFADVIGPVGGQAAGDIVRGYHAHEREVERESPMRSYKDVLVTALVRATAEQGVRLTHQDARSLLMRSWTRMRLFDDVEPMLAELRSRGYRLAVLTNCDDDLFWSTHRLFGKAFDFVLTAERVRGYKPERWHFRGFEMLTGVARPHWVHVANSWYHDIAPARALGLRHVWLDRDRTGEDAGTSIHVHHAIDVVGAVDRLVGNTSTVVLADRAPIGASA